MIQTVVFLQNRAHRAGAQTCLARLMKAMRAKDERIVLLCSENGWLTETCERNKISVVVEQFPASRSLWARIAGNADFAQQASGAIAATGMAPNIVHANDHTEGLLGLALAKLINARTAIFLRSSAMTKRDYFKYRCDQYDIVIAVGDELQRRVQSWDAGKHIKLIHDGIDESEVLEVKPKSPLQAKRVLVIGSAGEAKGWGDFAEAIGKLETKGLALPAFDFTGHGKPYEATFERLHAEFKFLERVDDFRNLVSRYDLVINPSRNESFGMAAIEVLAAGVPLISSRTGVIEQVLTNPDVLFMPRNPDSLARALENVFGRWSEIDFGVEHAQRAIREKFLIDTAVTKLDAAYRTLLGQ